MSINYDIGGTVYCHNQLSVSVYSSSLNLFIKRFVTYSVKEDQSTTESIANVRKKQLVRGISGDKYFISTI